MRAIFIVKISSLRALDPERSQAEVSRIMVSIDHRAPGDSVTMAVQNLVLGAEGNERSTVGKP